MQFEFSSYLVGNRARLHCRAQPVNVVSGKAKCFFIRGQLRCAKRNVDRSYVSVNLPD
jgi:hypothetical protein